MWLRQLRVRLSLFTMRFFFNNFNLTVIINLLLLNIFNIYAYLLSKNSFKFFFREAFLFDFFYKILIQNFYKNWIIKGAFILNFSFLNNLLIKFNWYFLLQYLNKISVFFNSLIKTIFLLFGLSLLIIFLLSLLLLLFI